MSAYDNSPKANRIRELCGFDLAQAQAYWVEGAIRKLGRNWWYTTIGGSETVGPFKTRKMAVKAADAHRALRIDMANNPCGYRDITSVLARKRLEVGQILMDAGQSEMEAFAEARRQFPDWFDPYPPPTPIAIIANKC